MLGPTVLVSQVVVAHTSFLLLSHQVHRRACQLDAVRSASHPTQVFTKVSEHKCYFILFRHRFKDLLHTTIPQLRSGTSVPLGQSFTTLHQQRPSLKLSAYFLHSRQGCYVAV